ncbi:MAG: thioredoxin [Prevotellaceae bacterium]|jgi:thioredoxin|nr:thioredoxin [Prevotellaceae bacterium]
MARLINSTDFPALVQDDKLLVVDFFATWCGPCKKLSPTLDEVSEEFGDRVNIVKVDVDESEDLAMTYGIRSVPTVLFFKNGQQVDKFVGALPKSEIVSKIENQL